MNVSVLFFGQITDITHCSHMVFTDVADTDQLDDILHATYPLLREIKYVITVDRKIIRENVALLENAEVALLPPFSGG
ncbi:MoaD/ThiS family protein [Olivibacter domesticus]|nr:MoaD/ThiS family protein [Olivibacter domesticus]